MTGRKTKRQSGAFYKKKRAKKAEEQQQLKGALEKFFENDQNQGSSSSASLFENPENVPMAADFPVAETETENTAPDTDVDGEMDTDVEASSSREKEKEIQDQVEQKVLGNESDSISMLLDLNDPSTWPNIISNKFIETLVEIGLVHTDKL